MLEINNTVKEMKNAFDGLISRLNMDEERIQWAWRYVNRNFPNWKAKRMKKKKKRKKSSQKCKTITEGVTYT